MMAGAQPPHAALPPWLRAGRSRLTVQIIAKPGAARRGLVRVGPDALVIALGAPAHRGKANRELIDFIAKAAGLPCSAVSVERGAGARHKLVAIETQSPAAVAAGILRLGAGG